MADVGFVVDHRPSRGGRLGIAQRDGTTERQDR
jgi:hypothetical protein